MVFEFEFQRPLSYKSRLGAPYYPISRSIKVHERPYSSPRYYKPYWAYKTLAYNPYTPYSSCYPYNYRPYNYLYELPNYTYRYITPKLPSLSEILATKEVDRFKYCSRAKAIKVETENYNFSSHHVSKEKMVRESRASSVPRFVRESSLQPSFKSLLRCSLERDFA